MRFLPLFGFQVILMVLFFVFVRYGGEKDHDIRGFGDTHVMIFIGFGFLMTFLKKYCYSALGFTWFLAALVVQWAVLCQSFFHMKNNIIYITKKIIFVSPAVHNVMTNVGSIFLWIYWPSFNSGLTNSDAEYQRAIVNTYLSLTAATVTTFILSSAVSHSAGKLDMVHVQNSTLAGGVAIGSVCNMHVSPGGAIAVGMGAGILSVLGYRYLTPKLTDLGIIDICGVNNLHGIPGIYSGLLSILFAYLATSQTYGTELGVVFPEMHQNATARTSGDQALAQLGALGVTLAISIVGGIITGAVTRKSIFNPLAESARFNDVGDWELP